MFNLYPFHFYLSLGAQGKKLAWKEEIRTFASRGDPAYAEVYLREMFWRKQNALETPHPFSDKWVSQYSYPIDPGNPNGSKNTCM